MSIYFILAAVELPSPGVSFLRSKSWRNHHWSKSGGRSLLGGKGWWTKYMEHMHSLWWFCTQDSFFFISRFYDDQNDVLWCSTCFQNGPPQPMFGSQEEVTLWIQAVSGDSRGAAAVWMDLGLLENGVPLFQKWSTCHSFLDILDPIGSEWHWLSHGEVTKPLASGWRMDGFFAALQTRSNQATVRPCCECFWVCWFGAQYPLNM